MMRKATEWLEDQAEIRGLLLFLDFDGTLSPIVDRPLDARPMEGIPEILERIGAVIPLAVISGRGAEDVRARLGVKGVHVAGSHGIEIVDPSGERHQPEGAEPFLCLLDQEEMTMRRVFADHEGVEIERKRFGVALHFRRQPEAEEAVREALEASLERNQGLKIGKGKKVMELQPDLDWDKGSALAFLFDALNAAGGIPMYIGDDVTDEDAFREVEARDGIGILVAEEDRPTAAEFRLDSPREVRTFLKRLSEKLALQGQRKKGQVPPPL